MQRTIAGFAGAVAFLLLLGAVGAVLFPVFNSARHVARNVSCIANMNSIGRAFRLYCGDNDERMPLDNWNDSLWPYENLETFRCPMLDAPFGYTMSEEAIGLDTTTVVANRSVAAFDGPGGKNSVGNLSDVRHRHDQSYAYVCFLDGHSEGVEPQELTFLLKPTAAGQQQSD